MSIDIGFGDIVHPIPKTIPLMQSMKGPLFEKTIQLNCYPKEFIFAEKLETIVFRGAANSRMKDFHDVISLISHSITHPMENLESIMEAVFSHRKTPYVLPLKYAQKEIERLQMFWRAYLRNLNTDRREDLPHKIDNVITTINDWASTNNS